MYAFEPARMVSHGGLAATVVRRWWFHLLSVSQFRHAKYQWADLSQEADQRDGWEFQ